MTGLTHASGIGDLIVVIEGLNRQIVGLQGEVQVLRGNNGGKNLADNKALDQVGKFDGEERHFPDFEFKLQQFLRPHDNSEAMLDRIKDLDSEPDDLQIRDMQDHCNQ